MKRGMVGGAYRGPVGLGRQRRTIRIVQVILILLAAGLLMFAGYSLGLTRGYDDGAQADALEPPNRPPASQTVVVALLGLVALGSALVLQGGSSVRLLTPKRLADMGAAGGAPIKVEDAGTDPPDETASRSGPS
jgi:hypothetical protein